MFLPAMWNLVAQRKEKTNHFQIGLQPFCNFQRETSEKG